MNLSKHEVLALRAVLHGCLTNKKLFYYNGLFFTGLKQPVGKTDDISFVEAANVVSDIIYRAMQEEKA